MVTVTLRLDSKSSGFCAVAYTDVFSQLLTSYVGMRRKPYARGGCHVRNNVGDTKFPTILIPDVHSPHAIPMIPEATLATREVPSLNCTLAPMTTLRARPGRIRFFLQDGSHSKPFGLVGKHMPNAPM